MTLFGGQLRGVGSGKTTSAAAAAAIQVTTRQADIPHVNQREHVGATATARSMAMGRDMKARVIARGKQGIMTVRKDSRRRPLEQSVRNDNTRLNTYANKQPQKKTRFHNNTPPSTCGAFLGSVLASRHTRSTSRTRPSPARGDGPPPADRTAVFAAGGSTPRKQKNGGPVGSGRAGPGPCLFMFRLLPLWHSIALRFA